VHEGRVLHDLGGEVGKSSFTYGPLALAEAVAALQRPVLVVVGIDVVTGDSTSKGRPSAWRELAQPCLVAGADLVSTAF